MRGIVTDVDHIVIVDDACVGGSGRRVVKEVDDPRVDVVLNRVDLGVCGAMVAGYRRVMDIGATVCVKLDADGQMDPALIPRFTAPLFEAEADWVGATATSICAMLGRCLACGCWAVLRFCSSASSRPATCTVSMPPADSPPSIRRASKTLNSISSTSNSSLERSSVAEAPDRCGRVGSAHARALRG